MRVLLGVILVASLGWSGYWWFGARSVENAFKDWFEARHQDGWVANATAIETAGFPNRFDTTITAPELADPTAGWVWHAPFLQVFRLSYDPGHIIVVWPDSQSIATPAQRLDVTSATARASLVLMADPTKTVERGNFEATDFGVISNLGWSLSVKDSLGALRQAADGTSVDLALDLKTLAPRSEVLDKLAEMRLVPANVEYLTLDATVGVESPLDLRALQGQVPAVKTIDLRKLTFKWGAPELWAAGEVTLDEGGQISGDVAIKLKNWQEVFELVKAAGWLPDGMAPSIEAGLNLMASMSGSSKTLDVPLRLRDGQISLGPLALGRLPKLLLR